MMTIEQAEGRWQTDAEEVQDDGGRGGGRRRRRDARTERNR